MVRCMLSTILLVHLMKYTYIIAIDVSIGGSGSFVLVVYG